MPGLKYEFVTMGIGDLLKQGRLEVPPNQRSYAWEDRHVLTLFQDLNEAISTGNDDYFLGTIVLVKSPNSLPIISDGQQRIATVTFLLCRIRDTLVKINREGSAQSLDTDFLRNIDRNTEEIVPRLKLNIEDNEFFVQRILLAPQNAAYDTAQRIQPVRTSNKRILRASDLATEFLTDVLGTVPVPSHAQHLLRWVEFIEKSANVAVVTVLDEAAAFRMFETLNDRGLRASQADILKNYFLSRASQRVHDAWGLWNLITSAIETLDEDDNERLVFLHSSSMDNYTRPDPGT